ncbi:MAG: metallophosphoesterase family protein [Candidatus Omnitrophota bacterium]|nr:metallophosphatase family protein [Candidatus Omnitrophota bacterium]MBU1929101.1 metallophosphatase family protein [Candidatus Omnitrophota bacterium]MBU1929148.1 metallophosphatase family protein [Candidatus Omnitrophota bacterium]MBU2035028.1 metallophosphatase family protein [Candidatus Omnitrophota bacterium]MBU2258061.1 metallophosphatase family protein [Candidatus Omnitrophota bacterium]
MIADTHVPDRAKKIPDEVLKAFRNVDMIIHAGDLVVLNVLEDLKKLCPDVRAVCGNMDCIHVRNNFPDRMLIKAGEVNIGVMHGFGPVGSLMDVLKEAFKKEKVGLIIFGHSHKAFNKNKDNIIFFNPGSPTDKLFSSYNSYGIIEIKGRNIDAKIVKL